MNCSQQCVGHCRDGSICNHMTGQCDRGCDTGWTGVMCNQGICDKGTCSIRTENQQSLFTEGQNTQLHEARLFFSIKFPTILKSITMFTVPFQLIPSFSVLLQEVNSKAFLEKKIKRYMSS